MGFTSPYEIPGRTAAWRRRNDFGLGKRRDSYAFGFSHTYTYTYIASFRNTWICWVRAPCFPRPTCLLWTFCWWRFPSVLPPCSRVPCTRATKTTTSVSYKATGPNGERTNVCTRPRSPIRRLAVSRHRVHRRPHDPQVGRATENRRSCRGKGAGVVEKRNRRWMTRRDRSNKTCRVFLYFCYHWE